MFEQIAWLPLCGGVTAVGLVLSFLAFRRRGAAAGMRLAAWSLLPVAAYLTGALGALWTIGATAVGFVTGLVLNPMVWAGVAVAGLAAVLFVVSGFMRGRRLSTGRKKKADPERQAAEQRGAGRPGAKPPVQPVANKTQPAVAPKTPKNDDDFSDIEALLKRRGIS
ncbi:cellulose synthase [Nonomuraea spiralis]|uniref:Cellulose synthase n=1 Tax=Nonomuraea spiralis TaxID=46182 RepID=A0ABV5I9H6_9ACTN|nr:cellulose synthase [Nonomuraea spiralis]GGT06879.1 hypothetical protein GCM10010176_059190 [Nonomuraea spiralis]